ncbi:MAG: hypothetical protein KDA22_02240 [Phycisphaerales bacterium]|nr:hypothetical protein [Phycisphaerales bacterium]
MNPSPEHALQSIADPLPGIGFETQVAEVGEQLGRSLTRVVELVPTRRRGPIALAASLGVDKVLASRLLKALRQREPIAIAHQVPGPEPLRRLLRSATAAGVATGVVEEAGEAVDAFERLIRETVGDRSSLDALISGWLPEARSEFELRRKQAAFKAMSELKGVACDTNYACSILAPGTQARRLDLVWVFGSIGLRRLRPSVPVKFTSRRIAAADPPRHPSSIGGEPVDVHEGIAGLRLDDYCSTPPPVVRAQRMGEVVHYMLADHGFGPRSGVDLVFAEVNRDEIDRYRVHADRRTYVFAEVSIPARTLVFDILVHEDVFPGSAPDLTIYDTVLEGVASVNDRSRDADRLDMLERIEPLGRGAARFRCTEVPRSPDLIEEVFRRLDWDGDRFAGWRCRIDYPVYGSQVVASFEPPMAP